MYITEVFVNNTEHDAQSLYAFDEDVFGSFSNTVNLNICNCHMDNTFFVRFLLRVK